ncbi:pyroglutamyl-peptidase I [Isoptericola jiangsuensis]|uniref:pyroglutamyl-peptidase I family protein n=1 Tax=Isoptericola jiangsuensis TaxID=548579 RepID=UPI001FE5C45A|nr:pyroglutamyl-peptidase I [Isoptericola jiangsuensis]
MESRSGTTVVVTGFEPFGGDDVNESWEAVRRLARDRYALAPDVELVTARLPVTFAGATAALAGLVAEHRPDVVVATGLAAGTDAVRLERVAVNVVDARIPDNDGEQPVDVPVRDGGPTAYLTTLPVKAALVALHAAGLPAVVSNTAGTYVCNAAFYALRHAVEPSPGVAAGFVHVPRADVVPAADAARALGVVVATAVAARHGAAHQAPVPAGTEH